MVRSNINGAIHLLRWLPALKHICYLSSVAVYGPPATLPCAETHPTEPTRLYGVTKLALEHFLRIYSNRSALFCAVLRISSVYGFPCEGIESSGAVSTFLRMSAEGRPIRLVKTARLLRDYVHVADVAEAVSTSTSRRCSGVFNIASGRGHSLLDIAEHAGKIVGKTPEIVIDQGLEPDSDFTTDVTYDTKRADRELGWQAQTRLYDAMRTLYENRLAQSELRTANVQVEHE